MTSDAIGDQATAQGQIATEILRVHEASYGSGAKEVIVHLLDDLVVVWIDEIALSLAEKTLIDAGRSATVLELRAAFQDAIEPTFTAVVERATGRRVTSFLSTTNLAAMCSVELFRLRPIPA